MVSNGRLRSENRRGGGGDMVAESIIVRVIVAVIQENAVVVFFVRAVVVVGGIFGDNITPGSDVGVHFIYNFHHIRLDVMLLL
jgi:hypothetical protein